MQVVLVTGSGRRIGAAIAQYCHEQGYNVALHALHSSAQAQAVASELNARRADSAIVLTGDCREVSVCQDVVAQAQAQWGRLDALINNASAFYPTTYMVATPDQWDDLMAINLKAPYFLAQAAYPALKGVAGCIINISDFHAQRPLDQYSIYCISKAGLDMLTRSLAKECAPDVRVNAIAPGNILWPEGEDNLLDAQQQAQLLSRNYLKKQGSSLDIAKAVMFLLRDAVYTTGHVLAVDGGRDK